MTATNWLRLTLCGFVAGAIWHLASVVFLSTFVPDFVASVRQSAPHPARGGEFFFAIDVLMGVWALWLYSAIVPRYGSKFTTVAIAGLAWWILKTLQSAKWAGLGFVELGPSLLPLGGATLGATVLALMTGAWLYHKVSDQSTKELPARAA